MRPRAMRNAPLRRAAVFRVPAVSSPRVVALRCVSGSLISAQVPRRLPNCYLAKCLAHPPTLLSPLASLALDTYFMIY